MLLKQNKKQNLQINAMFLKQTFKNLFYVFMLVKNTP